MQYAQGSPLFADDLGNRSYLLKLVMQLPKQINYQHLASEEPLRAKDILWGYALEPWQKSLGWCEPYQVAPLNWHEELKGLKPNA